MDALMDVYNGDRLAPMIAVQTQPMPVPTRHHRCPTTGRQTRKSQTAEALRSRTDESLFPASWNHSPPAADLSGMWL